MLRKTDNGGVKCVYIKIQEAQIKAGQGPALTCWIVVTLSRFNSAPATLTHKQMLVCYLLFLSVCLLNFSRFVR